MVLPLYATAGVGLVLTIIATMAPEASPSGLLNLALLLTASGLAGLIGLAFGATTATPRLL